MLASNWYQGPRDLLTKKPITTRRIWRRAHAHHRRAAVDRYHQGDGRDADPMAWGEVYSALQPGIIDGAEAQPTAITGAKLYEVVNNVTKPAISIS